MPLLFFLVATLLMPCYANASFQICNNNSQSISWTQNDEDQLKTASLTVPTREAIGSAKKTTDGHQDLFNQMTQSALHDCGLKSHEHLDATQRILRLKKIHHLHGNNILHPWQTAYSDGTLVDFNSPDLVTHNSLFIARVLNNPLTHPPANGWNSEWAEQLRNIVNRSLKASYWSIATSASLNCVQNTRFYTEGTTEPVGQILNLPPQNILASSPNDLGAPMPADFYCPLNGKNYFIETIDAGIASPTELMTTQDNWNEIYYATVNTDGPIPLAPTTTALFAVTDNKNPNRWADKPALIRDIAREQSVKLIRFSKPQA